jgi:hypothetical protein
MVRAEAIFPSKAAMGIWAMLLVLNLNLADAFRLDARSPGASCRAAFAAPGVLRGAPRAKLCTSSGGGWAGAHSPLLFVAEGHMRCGPCNSPPHEHHTRTHAPSPPVRSNAACDGRGPVARGGGRANAQ